METLSPSSLRNPTRSRRIITFHRNVVGRPRFVVTVIRTSGLNCRSFVRSDEIHDNIRKLNLRKRLNYIIFVWRVRGKPFRRNVRRFERDVYTPYRPLSSCAYRSRRDSPRTTLVTPKSMKRSVSGPTGASQPRRQPKKR